MSSVPNNDQAMIDSWRKNSVAWTSAVRNGEIGSRTACTNAAVIDAILECSPQSVIDLGCGEGWLARALAERRINVLGIDVTADLISAAQRSHAGKFMVLSYEQVCAGELHATADVVVCNFSLFGKECVDRLIGSVPTLLETTGSFIVQTVHPNLVCIDNPYRDGWREGFWKGFSDEFVDPPPWYFRTTESWVRLLEDNGLSLREIRNPVHPESGEPMSQFFIADLAEHQ